MGVIAKNNYNESFNVTFLDVGQVIENPQVISTDDIIPALQIGDFSTSAPASGTLTNYFTPYIQTFKKELDADGFI